MVICDNVAVAADLTAAPTWSQLYERVCELEAEMTQRASESRDRATRLERELAVATRRGSELTKQLLGVEMKLKRTERLLIKPGPLTHLLTSKLTRKMCYRKDYRAMRLTTKSDNTHMVCC